MSADVILLAYTAICQCGSCMKSVYEFQSLQVLVLWCALSTLYIYKVSNFFQSYSDCFYRVDATSPLASVSALG